MSNAAQNLTVTFNGSPADLAVTKIDSPDPVTAGTNLTYTVTVTNNGPSNVTGATVTDTFDTTNLGPIGSIAWTCAIAGTGNCNGATGSGNISRLIDLNSGAAATFVVTAPVLGNATGSVANTASAAVPAGFFDPTSANNSATTTTAITARADIGITKTAAATIVAGNNLAYTITVANNSTASTGSAATGISVSDTISRRHDLRLRDRLRLGLQQRVWNRHLHARRQPGRCHPGPGNHARCGGAREHGQRDSPVQYRHGHDDDVRSDNPEQ